MKNALKLLSFGTVVLANMGFQAAWAWGAKGHAVVAEVAAEIADEQTPFWTVNSQNLGRLSTVPDRIWKNAKTAEAEKPTHYFEIDALVADPAAFPAALFSYVKALAHFGQGTIQERGTAPWRGDQLYEMASRYLESGDLSSAVQMAGALSHYVGDLSQPLHVTRNYDGPEGSKTGIHAFFETKNLEAVDTDELKSQVAIRAKELLSSQVIAESFEGGFLNGTFALVVRTSGQSEKVIRIDDSLGREGKGAAAQLEMAIDQMADGAATMAFILNEIWKNAGEPRVKSGPVHAPDPRFVPVDFTKTSQQKQQQQQEGDCQ